MILEDEYNVIIAGAGPAGASASIFLSQAGIKHLLIDKAEFPRDKVCGDALSGKVLSHLKHAIPDVAAQFAKNQEDYLPSYGVRFVAPNGKQADIPFLPNITKDSPPPGFISKRIYFDNFLYNHTASDFAIRISNAELKDIEKKNDIIELQIKIGETIYHTKTKVLIGADGERGISHKYVSGGSKRNLEAFSAGIRAYYSGVTGYHDMNYIELHFLPEILPGYFWIFPMANGISNVGLGILSSEVSKHHLNLKKIFNDIINLPQFKERFANAKPESPIQGWGLPLGNKYVKRSTDNVILTGDAANLIDPFTGEGIGNAILSGRYAAYAAIKALENNIYTEVFFKENYDNIIKQKVGHELKVGSTLLRLCRYKFLFNFVVNKAARNKEFRDTISCMFANIDLRSKFGNPMFYLRMLFG